jgi:hypothetical protein
LFLFVLLFRTFLRGIEQFDGIVDGTFQLGLVSSVEFICKFLVGEGVAEVVRVRFEAVL